MPFNKEQSPRHMVTGKKQREHVCVFSYVCALMHVCSCVCVHPCAKYFYKHICIMVSVDGPNYFRRGRGPWTVAARQKSNL